MTANIALSTVKALPFDFEQAVQDFIKAKKDHLTTEGQPAPTAPHHFVEAAVRRIPGSVSISQNGQPVPGSHIPDDFVADYQIIDDTPPPPTIEDRKAAIAEKINLEAMVLLDKITPPLKRKLWSMQLTDAMRALGAGLTTPEHDAVLSAQAERDQASDAIQRHVAELESQLHDLPENMIDIWKPAPFPDV